MRREALLAAMLVACRKEPVAVGAAQRDASGLGQESDAASAGSLALVPGRCRATATGILLDDAGRPDDLEVGDGLPHGHGYAVGLLHRAAQGHVAAVALLGADASDARIIDLGPTLGDAPPPRLASCRTALVAGAFRSPLPGVRAGNGPDGGRDLALYFVGPGGLGPTVLSIAQHRDDSLAFDLACAEDSGLAVWDETVAVKPAIAARGVIRAASFDVGQRVAVARDVSPPDSDAEMPRVAHSGEGFVVVWLAHRAEAPEASGVSDAARATEATGEARTYGWLEMIATDRAGTPTGPVRRLTPTLGHVSAYDVLARSDPPRGPILIVARDDGEGADGAGGALLRVRVREDRVDPPAVLHTDGLGRGAPAFVDAPAPWLSWVGPREQVRLLPLDSAGEVLAPPSAEDALDEARPLLAFGPGAEPHLLVAGLQDRDRNKAAELRVFVCPR